MHLHVPFSNTSFKFEFNLSLIFLLAVIAVCSNVNSSTDSYVPIFPSSSLTVNVVLGLDFASGFVVT